MKKISLSKIFSTSAYHDTKADPDLIDSIVRKKRRMWSWLRFVKILVVIALLVLLGVALFWAYTLFVTTDFVDNSTSSLDGVVDVIENTEQQADENVVIPYDVGGDWEEEVLQEVKELLPSFAQ